MVDEIKLTDVNFLILGTASMLLMMFAIIGFAFIFQRKLARKAKAYREIEKLLEKQELQSAYFVIEGQEQERKRIAAELHDNIGSLLATLKIYSDLMILKEAIHEVKPLNRKINQISEELGNEIRKLSHEFDLRTLSGFGLKVAVEQLCEAINGSGKVKIDSFIDIPASVKEETSFHIYRIIQELFTNTLKHAEATKVRIEITLINDEITLIFEDNGTGFKLKQPGQGMGLQTIQSRVNHIRGKLCIDSSDNGTTFIIELNNHE